MADPRNYQTRMANTGVQSGIVIDEGLRSYMLKVYNLMALGLAITGVAAFVFFQLATTSDQAAAAATLPNGTLLTSLGVALYTSALKWVVMLAPVALVFYLSFRIQSMSVAAAQTTFWIYAALMGLSLSSIFLVYTQASIVKTLFITAASFGALSLYGYTTKRDLSGMGSFLVMGLFGLIIASLVNLFLASSALDFAISVIGVLIFAGLTAWDTQKIKGMYFEADDDVVSGRKAIMGALTLYLDFINLFLFLLRFLGNRE
ncbi:Bax inhibitor-1/YccA family protein [Sinorhizobium sp. BG8]|uniref:Bax inhibitor-1/YccA family protein n=1 Tax=Sinorhizobium sp. BG8 TaxID=2613773 RepID=UPI00193E5F31|nr:Bax inhibitor-1/YccA family protein [Sinorhizobium sp. BG8]QRM53491.1 Bax inhibitor-1/YccA family protein [Sinorhizobium sp. BG8]